MQLTANVNEASKLSLDNIREIQEETGRIDNAMMKVVRRNGSVVGFEVSKISIAMTKAFLAVSGGQGAASARVRELVTALTENVVSALKRRNPTGGTVHIEDIQDQVELALMRHGEQEVARSYVLYREQRNQERARVKKESQAGNDASHPALSMILDGVSQPLDVNNLKKLIEDSCMGLSNAVNADTVLNLTVRDLYDGVPFEEVNKSLILSARSLIEKDPAYSQVTARLLLNDLRREALGEELNREEMVLRYPDYFPNFVKTGVEAELLDERMLQFDLAKLGAALKPERDEQFGYLGLQTLYDRYFLHIDDRRIELPQAFFMRVAMGLSLGEVEREARAIEFYNLLSSFDFMSST
ncbi:MAG: ribonucleoside-diphosphate reductase subunit alpha, partial [Betaproteobacteria bacterium]|nr:ribonucleoside-diphosphate reductase subunit alpha [Betaproteobacteria bacterium]